VGGKCFRGAPPLPAPLWLALLHPVPLWCPLWYPLLHPAPLWLPAAPAWPTPWDALEPGSGLRGEG
jgi:hypothetical protein